MATVSSSWINIVTPAGSSDGSSTGVGTLRMMATTSLSFSLQRSFWTQKSSFCSSCLSAGRRSDDRNLGNSWHSLYLCDRQAGRHITSDVSEIFTCRRNRQSYLTLATGSWTRSSAGIRKCLLKYFLEKISVAVSQTSRNLRRFQ